MTKYTCPECGQKDCSPIQLGENPTQFGMISYTKDGKPNPHGFLHVLVYTCSNCGFTWLKVAGHQLKTINNLQD